MVETHAGMQIQRGVLLTKPQGHAARQQKDRSLARHSRAVPRFQGRALAVDFELTQTGTLRVHVSAGSPRPVGCLGVLALLRQ